MDFLEFEKEMLRVKKQLDKEQIDEEDAHRIMDNIICDLLIDLGYEKGVEIFKDTPKWYS